MQFDAVILYFGPVISIAKKAKSNKKISNYKN